ncbi:MAG: cysteine hydrolase [Armatimonadetes bacterium]|nr:cysteine hydrolase [Armatimonadota bacterium]
MTRLSPRRPPACRRAARTEAGGRQPAMAALIEGKKVYTELPEIVDPRRSVLLVVDMQHEFCARGGAWYPKAGASPVDAAIPRVRDAVASARKAGVSKIVYARTAFLAEDAGWSLSPAYLYSLTRGGIRTTPLPCVDGAWGAEILPDLAPGPGDLVVTKMRPSAFLNTSLDLILRSNGVETVIVTGVETHTSIQATVRNSTFHEYYTVVVTDCVASHDPGLHDAALSILETRVDLVALRDLERAWAQAQRNR